MSRRRSFSVTEIEPALSISVTTTQTGHIGSQYNSIEYSLADLGHNRFSKVAKNNAIHQTSVKPKKEKERESSCDKKAVIRKLELTVQSRK